MKNYILIAHIDYEQHKAVLHSTDKSKLNKLACKLTKAIKECESINCGDVEDKDVLNVINIEHEMQKILPSFSMYIDEYLVEEIQSI